MTLCNDSDACNGSETCDPIKGCVPGSALMCDDSNDCTSDSCAPQSGCGHVDLPDTTTCATGFCTAGACLPPPPP